MAEKNTRAAVQNRGSERVKGATDANASKSIKSLDQGLKSCCFSPLATASGSVTLFFQASEIT